MATNKITRTKIMSYAHENIYSTVNNRSYVVDPKSPNSTTRMFVYHNDPFSKGKDYGKRPYIIVNFPKIEDSNISADGNYKKIMWENTLIVRTSIDGDSNSSTGAGISDMEDIVDDLLETFDSKVVKDELRLLNMYDIKISVVDNDELVDDNSKKIFETKLELTFNTRMKTGEA